jgi:hypothetical protein
VLQKVKDVVLVQAPSDRDEADRVAAEYFRTHADGKEQILAYNGELYDVTLYSTRDSVRHDPEKLRAVIKAGKPMIFLHNHPAEDGRSAMFPSYDDFGVAGLFSFMVYREDPSLTAEFRIIQPGKKGTIVSYGFKRSTVDAIRNLALEYRGAVALKKDVAQIELRQELLDYHLAQDSFNDICSMCVQWTPPSRIWAFAGRIRCTSRGQAIDFSFIIAHNNQPPRCNDKPSPLGISSLS